MPDGGAIPSTVFGLDLPLADMQPEIGGSTGAQFFTPNTYDVNEFGAVGDGVVDDTEAFEAAIAACEAGGGGTVFVPGTDDSYFFAAASLPIEVPSGVSIRGVGYKSKIEYTGAASASVVVFRNEGFGSSTAADHIEFHDLRFVNTRDLAGDEGPYSNAINLRRTSYARVSNCFFEGNLGGLHLEACTYFDVRDCVGYRNGDVSFRVNWSGSDGDGNPPAQGGTVRGCRAIDNGFQLDDGTAVPEPGGPVGSALLCTQSDVVFSDITVHNSKANAFEGGGGCSGVVLDGWHLLGTTASRALDILISDMLQVTVRNVSVRLSAAATARIYVSGSTGAGQDNILIENIHGTLVTPTAETSLVHIADTSTDVVVRNVTADGMIITVSAADTADVTIENCTVRNARRMGFNLASAGRLRLANCTAINPGNQASGGAEFLSGFVIVGLLTTDNWLVNCKAIDTRAGGSRTMQYGFYIVGGTLQLPPSNYSVNHVTAAKLEASAPTLTVPTALS